MIVQNLYHANLKIDAEGTVTLENAWQLARAEPAAGLEALLDEARAWAGKIGDPFRIPAADGSYAFSSTIRVSGIECRPVSLAVCQVVFSGTEFAISGGGGSGTGSDSGESSGSGGGGGGSASIVATGSVSDAYGADGAHRRTRSFRAPAALPAELIPRPGQLLDWEGGAFLCESCTVTVSGLAADFKVVARETTLAELGLAVSGRDADGFETKTAVWFAAAGEYETFLAQHPIGGAEAWAGEQFLLAAVESKPVGKIGCEVTLKTRKAETRRLAAVRTEEFAGISRSGAILREIVWKAHWRVVATDLPNFFLLTGTSPADWAEPGCIVTKITPNRLSDQEYEVMVEAQHSGNPDLYVRYSVEDRSHLDTRTDVSVDMVEFHVAAEMAGYRKLPDGQYLPIPNWSALRGCPFQSESRLSEAMIEKTVRCLVITVSVYASGDTADQIDSLANWAASRIFNGKVAGITGSYLKTAQHCKETYNDSGRLYTRITRSYQKAPESMTWSTNYWENV